MDSEFEQRLQRQPLRQVPPDWRAEILAVVPAVPSVTPASCITHQSWLSALLWPHPKAWAGLAAVWIFILVLNVSMRDGTPQRLVAKASPPSPEMMVELRKQQRMFAELVGPRDEAVADRSKSYPSKPRTWLEETRVV